MLNGKSSWYFDNVGIYRCSYCHKQFEPGHSVTCVKQSHLSESCKLGETPDFYPNRSLSLYYGLRAIESYGC